MSTIPRNPPVLDRAGPLFEKKVPTQGFTHTDEIVIRVLTGKRNVGQLVEEVVHVEITDQKDPFIIYYIDICEGNLVTLRDEHKLSVPMNNIPKVVIEMLERCLLGPITTPLSSFPITYAARLNVVDGLFSIVEKTHYSNEVVHFSLPMTRGDDKAVQEYLASRLELSLSVASRQGHNILQLNATLQNEVEQKEQALQELYDLRTQTDVRQQATQSSHSQELSNMRMECAHKMEDQRSVFEAEKSELRREISETLDKLKTEYAAHEHDKIEFQKSMMDSEATIRELNRKLTSEISARERMESEWKGTSEKKGLVESEHVAVLGLKVQLEAQIAVLERDLKGKVEFIENQKLLLRGSEEAYRKLEERLTETQNLFNQSQQRLTGADERCTDLQNKLSRMEERATKLAKRIEIKDDTLRRQEALVTELKDKLSAAKDDHAAARDAEKEAQRQVNDYKRQLEVTTNNLNEANDTIAGLRQALAYSQEQNTQHTLGAAYAPIHDMDLGGGDGSGNGSPYRPAPYAPANVNTVTPVHHYSNPSRSSGGGYTSTASHKHERSYTGVSPEAYTTGPTTDQLLGTSKTSPFLSTNRAYSSSAAHPTSTETKTYDTLEKVRRLGIDKGFNGDITFLSRMHGSESPTVLSGVAVNDINLEELDYYSLAVDTKRTTTTTTTGASPPHKASRVPARSPAKPLHEWQQADFGKA